jgi:glycine oxidase
MSEPDITIMGAGIFGLSCAWACVRRGARVRVFDTGGVGAGASGGLVGALSPHVPGAWNAKKQFQFESLTMARDWWAKIRDSAGTDPLFGQTGRLQSIPDEAALALARERAEAAVALWGGAAKWSVITADKAGAFAPASPTGWLIRDTLSARIAPRAALAALVAAIRAKGGDVITGTGPGTGPVIWATGTAGLAELSAAFGKPVGGGVKGQAALLRHDARDAPQVFADALHIVPHGDGTVAVGSTSERVWSDETDTDAQLDALIAKARALVPALADAPVIDRWAALRPRAVSRAPLLGEWPGRAGHFVANGGFKIGFGIAPKVGEVMAELVLDGRNAIPDGMRVSDLI